MPLSGRERLRDGLMVLATVVACVAIYGPCLYYGGQAIAGFFR